MKKQMLKCLFTLSFLLLFTSCNEKSTDPILDPEIDWLVIDDMPVWSPDGKTIAFFHGGSLPDKRGLYLIDTNGTNNRLIFKGEITDPCWSPDGNWIAFGLGAQLFKIKPDGSELIQLTKSTYYRNFGPSWSPDGKWIAYDTDEGSPSGLKAIWKMRSDGSNRVCIASDYKTGEIRYPDWTKNSNLIVHLRYLVGVLGTEIFVMDSSGNNVKRITNNNYFERNPKLSPNQDKILFGCELLGLPQSRISTIGIDGKNFAFLVNFQTCLGDWSPDGKLVVCTDARKINGHLIIIDTNGNIIRKLTN